MGRPVRFTPAVEGAPEIEVVPDVLRGPRVLAGGRRISAVREGGRRIHPIPMADGSTRPLRLVGGFLGLGADFEGRVYQVEPRLRLWETFLVVLPLAILVLALEAPTLAGTIVGALITGLAVGIALVAIRSTQATWLRALVALGAGIVGYVVADIVIAAL